MRWHKYVFALVLFSCLGAARADETAIRRALEPKMGGVRIEAITASPIPGVYEVQYRSADGIQIVFTDASGTYVIQNDGHMVDLRAGRDLTEDRLRKANAVPFDKLPLDLA